MRSGLDESSRYPDRGARRVARSRAPAELDQELAAQAEEQAVAEFNKFLAFALNDKTLRPQEEEACCEFGREQGLTQGADARIDRDGTGECPARVRGVGVRQLPNAATRTEPRQRFDPNEDFMRMLRLSGLDTDSMTDDQRDAFINMAENLGIDPGEAEDMVDLYLEEIEEKAGASAARNRSP